MIESKTRQSFRDFYLRVSDRVQRCRQEALESIFWIFPYRCHSGLITGGTDNHLMLLDLHPKGLTGKIAAEALDEAMITVNKNEIPFDEKPPNVTSGIRIGTPAVTSRGMQEAEMVKIADMISQVINNLTLNP